MFTFLGLSTCDTCRKARRWLGSAGIDYQVIDVRKDTISAERRRNLLEQVGPATLINRRSTTWRNLSESERQSLDNDQGLDAADHLLATSPSLMKRPILMTSDKVVMVGFDATRYQQLINDSGDAPTA